MFYLLDILIKANMNWNLQRLFSTVSLQFNATARSGKIEMRCGVVSTYTTQEQKLCLFSYRKYFIVNLPRFWINWKYILIYSNLLIFPDILSRIDQKHYFRVIRYKHYFHEIVLFINLWKYILQYFVRTWNTIINQPSWRAIIRFFNINIRD